MRRAKVYIAHPGEANFTEQVMADGTRLRWRATTAGELVALGEGIGHGFLLCAWCGWGTLAGNKAPPTTHRHLLAGRECTGPLEARTLGHKFQTDLLEVDLDALTPLSNAVAYSTLYAVVEAAAEILETAQDDIDGTLINQENGHRSRLFLFDTTPGGAGNAVRIGQRLDDVLEHALQRVDRCDCGEETSCYQCLRSYRNQSVHHLLARAEAVTFLRRLLGDRDRLAAAGRTG